MLYSRYKNESPVYDEEEIVTTKSKIPQQINGNELSRVTNFYLYNTFQIKSN